MSCSQSFAGGGSQEPIWWPVGGKANQGQGLGMGGTGGGVWLEEQLLAGGEGGSTE